MIKKVFFILALCVFSSTLGIGIVAPLLPLYVSDMGANGVWLGIIVASYGISNTVFVPITGRLSDRRGRKNFLTVGLLAYALISLGYIWADNVALLALVRLLQGVAGALTFPIAMAYVGDLAPEKEEGKWMGYANFFFFSGIGAGPLIGGILVEHFDMSVSFYAMCGFNLIAFFIALILLPETSRRKTVEEGSAPSFKEMSTSNMIKGLFSFRLAQAIGQGGIFTFLPIFAAMNNLNPSLIGVLMAVAFSSMNLFTPIGGLIADRYSRKNLTITGSLLFAVSLALIPLTSTFGQLITVLLLQGISGAISMPAATALIVEEGRRFGMGSTMGAFMMAMSLGIAVGPIISGSVHDWLDINSVFYFGTIITIIGTGLFIWFTRAHRSQRPLHLD